MVSNSSPTPTLRSHFSGSPCSGHSPRPPPPAALQPVRCGLLTTTWSNLVSVATCWAGVAQHNRARVDASPTPARPPQTDPPAARAALRGAPASQWLTLSPPQVSWRRLPYVAAEARLVSLLSHALRFFLSSKHETRVVPRCVSSLPTHLRPSRSAVSLPFPLPLH